MKGLCFLQTVVRSLTLAIGICCTIQARCFSTSSPEDNHSFFYLTSDTVRKAPTFTDEEFYRLSTQVIFKVGSTQIRPDDEFFDIYRNDILPSVNKRHLQLRKIFIRGAASPEGSYANNQRLSRARSEALLNVLKSDLDYQYLDAEVDMSSVTEDYGYLCVLMANAADKDYETVKGIYDGSKGDELRCKKSLMAYDRGRLWQRLLKDYFPQLRAARLILWFSEPDEEHAPEVRIEPVTLQPTFRDIGYDNLDTARFVAPYLDYSAYTRRHLIAVRTNLLHDFFYMPGIGFTPSPNIQFEYYPKRGHLTYNVGMTWGTHRHWSSHQFFQVRDVQFELRRYFRGKGRFMGAYLGAYVHGDVYGIGLSDKRGWQGEGGGLGLSAGYTMPLNRKKSLRLEFMAAFGFFITRYDPYVYGNPITGNIDGDYYYDYVGNASDFKRRNYQRTWLGPTNLGIQLTYDIIYRKKQSVQKGGMQ